MVQPEAVNVAGVRAYSAASTHVLLCHALLMAISLG